MADVNFYCRMLWAMSNGYFVPSVMGDSEAIDEFYFKGNLSNLVNNL